MIAKEEIIKFSEEEKTIIVQLIFNTLQSVEILVRIITEDSDIKESELKELAVRAGMLLADMVDKPPLGKEKLLEMYLSVSYAKQIALEQLYQKNKEKGML